MKSRREVIRSIAFAAVAYPTIVNAKTPTDEECRASAAKLAMDMKACKGGEWRVSFDKKSEFILISKKTV
jgi:hypothetical protein